MSASFEVSEIPDVNLEINPNPSCLERTLDAAKQLIGRTALALSLATGFAVAETVVPVTAAYAESGDYPDADATDCSATYGIYSWCKKGGWISPRNYGYRNCTDWAAWEVTRLTDVATPRNLGNANTWDDNWPKDWAKTHIPEVGDVAQSNAGDWGHVGVVESVSHNSSGSITSMSVSEYNQQSDGNYTLTSYMPDDNGVYWRNAAHTKKWDNFLDPNGVGTGEISSPSPPASSNARPAAISFNGELDVYIRGGDGQIYKDTWGGDHWTGFSSLGGNMAGDPVAVQYGQEMDVVAIGKDGHVYKNTWNGAFWSGFNDMGGDFSGVPAVVAHGAELAIFAKGSGGAIYKNSWLGDHWTGFSSLGGAMAANPAAISFGGELDVYARDGYGTVYKNTWNGASWSGFSSLRGNMASSPTAIAYGNEMDVFAASGDDGNLFKNTWNGSTWSGFNFMGTGLGPAATPAAISFNGELDVYARGKNGDILKNTWNGSSWSGLNSLGGSNLGNPTAVQHGQEMDVFAADTNGHVYKTMWNGSRWSGFSFLG